LPQTAVFAGGDRLKFKGVERSPHETSVELAIARDAEERLIRTTLAGHDREIAGKYAAGLPNLEPSPVASDHRPFGL